MKKGFAMILGIAILALILTGTGTADDPKEEQGILSYLEGSAQKSELNMEKWEFMKDQDPVKGGEKVKTLNESRAELKLDIGKTIRMAPLTEVDILKLYKEVTEKGQVSDMKVRVSEGQIYSKIDALGEDEELEIITPLASATIRGTVFQVTCDGEEKVELDVIKGEVWVYSNNITDPRDYFKKNWGANKKPFVRINKPYHRVSKEKWMEVIKNMQRITIGKDGTTEISNLKESQLNKEWLDWNKKLDEGKQ